MDLPKVEGTQVRGKIYHLNLRIKPEIQDLYGGKTHLRGSLRTSDPVVAEREVKRRKDELAARELERARQAEVEDIVSQLSPEQRAAYDEAGGLEGLLEGFERKRGQATPGGATGGPTGTDADESEPDPYDDDWPLGTGGLTLASDEAGDLADDDDPYAEDVFAIADLFEEYAPALDAETEEAMRHVVRLFTEFHGPVAFDELTIAHLDEFAEAARGLPADMLGKLADGTYVRDLPFAEMVAWTVHAEARPISETTRFQYVRLLKQLMFFGVPRYRRGDPWSDYRLQITRRETIEPPAKKSSRRFTPSEWTLSDAMMRLLEVAIVVFVLLVMFMLWQSRT